MKPIIVFLVLLPFLTACGPATPTPTGDSVYIRATDLLVMESYPVQISLHVTGDLPTPCHELRYDVAAPDDQNRVYVTVWSESDPETVCIQVLEAFEVNVPIRMEGAADGAYSVWLNDELVGEFSYPA